MDPDYPLLPADDEIDLWQYCLKTAIINIQKNAKPYERGAHSGVTEHLYYKESRVGYAKGFSYCCGATYEAFIKAWKECFTEEDDENMTAEQAKEMRAHFFVYGDKDKYGNFKYALGAPGGLLWLAKQPGLEWLNVEYLNDPAQIQFGDFVQMQFTREPMGSGHSVIGLGTGEWNGNDIVNVWSSNNYYDQKWPHSSDQAVGNGWDYYRQYSVRDGWQRKFHIGRIKGE